MAEFRVLLVDDEEELVSTLVERLGYRDIEADYALDGHSALRMMQMGSYDIVVLDLKLPGMGGREVLRRLRVTYPKVPVLMITGHGAIAGDQEARPEGVSDYLLKPVQLDELIARMREAVSGHER
jgi:DNA-binding response OmpR family regulator